MRKNFYWSMAAVVCAGVASLLAWSNQQPPSKGAPSGQTPGQPAIAKQPRDGDFTVVSWNLQWFFDADRSDNQSDVANENAPTLKKDYEWRLDVTADAIAKLNPTILAVQEFENRKVCDDLAKRIKEKHQIDYQVCFTQGRDTATEQDVACFAKNGVNPQFFRANDRDFDPRRHKVPSKQIMLEFTWGQNAQQRKITLINVHLKAGTNEGDELDRIEQAEVINKWVKDAHKNNRFVMVMGDMNSVPPLAQLKGKCVNDTLKGKDTPNDKDDDLDDLVDELEGDEKITYGGKRSTLDHILVSPKFKKGPGLAFDSISNERKVCIRGDGPDFKWKGDRRFWRIPEEERDLSDHYPLKAGFKIK